MNKVNRTFRITSTAIMAILLSGMMTIYITFINLGMVEGFVYFWLKAWVLAAPAAFVSVMILASPVQKLTTRLLDRKPRKTNG